MQQKRVRLPWPTAPGNGATILLFSTMPVPSGGALPGGLTSFPGAQILPPNVAPRDVDLAEIVWHKNDQASAANGLRLYVTDDGGVTWHESDAKDNSNAASIGSGAPVQVPALVAPAEWRESTRISQYQGVAMLYTAGATGPTAVTGWRGTITLHLNSAAVQL